MLGLRPGSIWEFVKSQDFAYWATCMYLVIEYVRPQQLWDPLYGLPLGQIVLGLGILAQFLGGRGFALRSGGTWLLLAFTAVIFLSSLFAYRPEVAQAEWRLWISWVVIFLLIINTVTTPPRFLVFMLVWLASHYYMSQGGAKQLALRGFSFASYGVKGAPGWFENSGEFGIAMCMFLPIAWHYFVAARRSMNWLGKLFVIGMPITAALSVVGSSSRGALLGMGVVALWALLMSRHRVRALVGALALGALVWVVLPAGFKDRFSSAGDDYTSQTRLTYWRAGMKMAADHPVLGVGYNNWLTYYEQHFLNPFAGKRAAESRLQVSHNIFIQCVAELGFTGLFVFALLIIGTFRINLTSRRLARDREGHVSLFVTEMAYGLDAAMVGYLVSGFFVTVLYYPFFWINFALTVALRVSAERIAMRPIPVSHPPAFRRPAAIQAFHRAPPITSS